MFNVNVPGILCGMLSVPQNIVMDLNHLMLCHNGVICRANETTSYNNEHNINQSFLILALFSVRIGVGLLRRGVLARSTRMGGQASLAHANPRIRTMGTMRIPFFGS